MNRIFSIAIFTVLMSIMTSCSQITQSAKLAEGQVVLAIDTVRAHVNVDTTQTLIGMANTTRVLGFIRLGDRKSVV